MNNETVVKILTEAREAVRKYVGILEQEQGFGPITGVYIENYKLLVSEIGDAIQYLEKNHPIVCDACSCDITPETCGTAYCKLCIRDGDQHVTNCYKCGRELTANEYAYCGDCHEHQ